jgi:hypothetical protein
VQILDWGSGDVSINLYLIMFAINHSSPSEVVLVETLTRIGLTVCRRCRHGAKIVEPIVELQGICDHLCSWLGRRNVVGTLVGSCMRAEAPVAGNSR